MCSLFMPIRMENYQGDLTDILRAGSSSGGMPSHNPGGHHQGAHLAAADNGWHFPSATPMEDEEDKDNFGDPFSSFMRDPLLHELDFPTSTFFSGEHSSEMSIRVDESVANSSFGAGGGGLGLGEGGDPVLKRPCNIFSRMLQISPSGKAPVVATCDLSSPPPRGMMKVGGDMVINGNSSASTGAGGKGCLLENTGGVQISSPRNPGGIKRRKSQAKKVVCIPAPAAVNSRPTGEVVPSDLWAWRKYGQKPIKGSPYPRGYYRCSSSKGCPARKQVERSRTDPNMLVITYTSEHNHPWPTQRNALAGSTRSQPSKNAAAAKSSPNSTSHHQKPTSPMMLAKEEQNETMSDHIHVSSVGSGSTVKEEIEEIEKRLELENQHQHQHQNHGFAYRPLMPEDHHQQSSHQEDSFFADLGEIEADPLNLLFSQCFTADEQQEGETNKAAAAAAAPLDPFNLLDWSGDHNNTNSASFGEVKRRL